MILETDQWNWSMSRNLKMWANWSMWRYRSRPGSKEGPTNWTLSILVEPFGDASLSDENLAFAGLLSGSINDCIGALGLLVFAKILETDHACFAFHF